MYTQDYFTNEISFPLFECLKHFKDKKCTGLEIGCFEGKSTNWLFENILSHPDSKLHVIDTFEGGKEHIKLKLDNLHSRYLSNVEQYLPKIYTWRDRSIDVLKKILYKFDFIIIDGSHQAKNVIVDLVLGFHQLNSGGIMFMDDYTWCLNNPERRIEDIPKTAIDLFLSTFRHEYKLIHLSLRTICIQKN